MKSQILERRKTTKKCVRSIHTTVSLMKPAPENKKNKTQVSNSPGYSSFLMIYDALYQVFLPQNMLISFTDKPAVFDSNGPERKDFADIIPNFSSDVLDDCDFKTSGTSGEKSTFEDFMLFSLRCHISLKTSNML